MNWFCFYVKSNLETWPNLIKLVIYVLKILILERKTKFGKKYFKIQKIVLLVRHNWPCLLGHVVWLHMLSTTYIHTQTVQPRFSKSQVATHTFQTECNHLLCQTNVWRFERSIYRFAKQAGQDFTHLRECWPS